MLLLHATCVEIDRLAVLLRGPSGSGKSDLALRLIDVGARLVADDQVELEASGGRLWARAPAALAGILEVRGIGLRRLAYRDRASVGLVIDLVAPERIERLPEPATEMLAGIVLPRLALAPFEAAAVAKLRLVMRQAALHGGVR
jgi:serine kinase of HPr protein (carbohydrate metabolism regulator)